MLVATWWIKKFGMSDSKAISTPMGTNGNLDSDASGNMVDQKISIYDWKPTLCDLIKAGCHVQCMHVCKISSLTKRKSFEGYKENIEVIEAYTKYWFVVSQRSKV